MRIFHWCILWFTIGSITLSQSIPEVKVYSLFRTDSEAANLLYPGSIAVDEWRGICYIASENYPRVTIVSLPELQITDSITEDDGLTFPIDVLAVEPSTRLLYFTEHGSFPMKVKLSCIDLYTNVVKKQVDLGQCDRLQLIPDPKRNVVYASTGREHILILDAKTLVPVDSIEFGDITGGMSFDSTNSELHVAQARPVNGVTTIKRFSVENKERLATLTLVSDDPLDRIEVNAELGRILAYGRNYVWLLNEFGVPIFDYPINGGIGDIGVSKTYRRSYFIDRLGEKKNDKGGVLGKLQIFGFQQFDIDSLEIGSGSLRMVVHDLSKTVVVVSKETAMLYILRLPDFFPLAEFPLGVSADDAAILESSGELAVINRYGSPGGYSLVTSRGTGIHQRETGLHPASVVALQRERSFAVMSHYESDLYRHNKSGAITATIESEISFIGNSAFLPMLAASNDGRDLVLAAFPETGSYSIYNTASERVEYEFYLEELTNVTTEGEGAIQPCFVPGQSYYCFLFFDDKQLVVYNASNHELEKTIDLATLDWTLVAPFERSCLQPGLADGEVFVGPYGLSVETTSLPQLVLPPNTRSLGSDDAGLVWALRSTSQGLVLLQLDIGAQKIYGEYLLNDIPSFPNAIAASPNDKRLVLGFSKDAEIYDVTFPEISPLWSLPVASENRIDVFPNPAIRSLNPFIAVVIPNEFQRSGRLSIYDIAGRLYHEQTIPENGQSSVLLEMPMSLYPHGIYYLDLSNGIQRINTLLFLQ